MSTMPSTRRQARTAFRRAQDAMTLRGETRRMKSLRREIEQMDLIADSWNGVGDSLSTSMGTMEIEVSRAKHRAH